MWIKLNACMWSASLHTERLEISLNNDVAELITTFRRKEKGVWTAEYESMRLGITVCSICGSSTHVTGNCPAANPALLTDLEVYQRVSSFVNKYDGDNSYHIEIGEYNV